MMNGKNYYRILHVQPDAPTEVIRSSYRTMMQRLKMHPDLGGDHDNAALVNEAYAVLMNSTARAEYDTSLELAENIKQPDETANESPTERPYSSNKYNHKIDYSSCCPFCQTSHSLEKTIEPDSVCSDCDSTLFPAAKQTFEKSGQRIIQRIDKQWPVTFFIHWPDAIAYAGQTQDVSLNGMQMLTAIALEEGQIIKITSKTLDAVARVMNYREDFNEGTRLWRIGMEFMTLRFHRTRGTFIDLDV